ncbi:MAG: hypothetical protein LBQ36_03700 [Synergistaceae bacterium]|jgi:hypothetical protein|nr:hypothetical protein [Synergistaceae bacterium]
MGFFDKGRHSINKKYERFSDVHKISTKYRKRSRSYRPKKPDTDSGDFALPARREIYGKKHITVSNSLRSVPGAVYAILVYSKFRERMRRIRESNASAVLGYVPMKLFIGISLLTFGLYPYAWLWGNAYAFIKVCGDRVSDISVKRLAAVGFCVQALLPAAVMSYAAGRLTGSEQALILSSRASFALAASYVLLVMPMKCSNYFRLRWALRSAVISWDSEGVMVGRTMTSWLKLFFFGAAYIQYHINRLMGLGMPGFADVSEIEMDISIAELIDNYVTTGRSDRMSASWTKDDWQPGDDEYEEEDDG